MPQLKSLGWSLRFLVVNLVKHPMTEEHFFFKGQFHLVTFQHKSKLSTFARCLSKALFYGETCSAAA